MSYTHNLYNTSISSGGWYGYDDTYFLVYVVNKETFSAKISSVVLPQVDIKFQHFLKVTCKSNLYSDIKGNLDRPYCISLDMGSSTSYQNLDLNLSDRKVISSKHEYLE